MKKGIFSFLLILIVGGGLFALVLFRQVFVGPVSFWFQNIQKQVKDVYISFIETSSLYSQNQEMQKQIALLESEKVELEKYQDTIEILSQEAQIQIPNDGEKVLAQVLDHEEYFLSGKKLINVGEKHGIKKGQLVGIHGVLVGEISEVFLYTSEVLFITHSESLYTVKLPDGNKATISGLFDSQKLLLSKVPRESDLSSQDVLTMSPTKMFPFRLPLMVGKVEEIQDIPEEPFLEAIVKPLLDYDNVSDVIVYVN